MKPPSSFAFALSAGRAASARGKRHVFNPNRDISPERNRFDLGRSLTRKGNDDMSTTSERKGIALETAIAELRKFQQLTPVGLRKSARAGKAARILAELEALADRVAAR